MRFPLDIEAFLTDDDTNARQRVSKRETHIPYGNHCGAFGTQRLYDIHSGIDLYAPDGEDVFAMQDGIVVAVYPFTGPAANLPWWHDTMAICIEDSEGVWLYGEVEPSPLIKPGVAVLEGERIGAVKQVLRIDKGRPMSMLHMERYLPGTREFVEQWLIGEPQPQNLVDPTELLAEFDSFLEWCRWEDSQGHPF